MSRPATSRLKVNPPVGELPVLQYCSPEQLQIDPVYQRGLDSGPSQSLIRRIAQFWDWGLCQPLYVARRSDGGLYVVDGQHRLAAARLRGDIWQLPCVVAAFAGAAEEAAHFVALNQQRRPLNKLQIFKAALAAGDEEARQVMAAIEGAGLKLASSTNLVSCGAGSVSNVGGLTACLKSHGRQALGASLAVLATSYPNQVLRYSGTLFPGIAEIVAAELSEDHDFAAGERFILLCEMVGGAAQEEWVRDIQAANVGTGEQGGRRAAAIDVFAAAWAECASEALEEAA
jgi:hypothetical protein